MQFYITENNDLKKLTMTIVKENYIMVNIQLYSQLMQPASLIIKTEFSTQEIMLMRNNQKKQVVVFDKIVLQQSQR